MTLEPPALENVFAGHASSGKMTTNQNGAVAEPNISALTTR